PEIPTCPLTKLQSEPPSPLFALPLVVPVPPLLARHSTNPHRLQNFRAVSASTRKRRRESALPARSPLQKFVNTHCSTESGTARRCTRPPCSATPASPQFPTVASRFLLPHRLVQLPARECRAARSDTPCVEILIQTPAKLPPQSWTWKDSSGRELRTAGTRILRW